MRRESLYEGIGALDEALLERSEKAIENVAAIENKMAIENRKAIENEKAIGNKKNVENEKVIENVKAEIDKRATWKKSAAAAKSQRARKKKYLSRWLAAAACIMLLFTCAGMVIDRLGYFSMGCSAYAGEIVDGVYYYWVPHSGVWRYTPEEGSRRIVSAWFAEGYQVNSFGTYYQRGRSLYVREHETGKKRRLYRAGLFEGDFIGASLQENGNVVVTVYNKHQKERYQLLVDGITGEVLEQLTDRISYDSRKLLYTESHFQLGDRQFVVAEVEEGSRRYDLLENGKSLLSEGEQLYSYSSTWREKIGDNLYVPIGFEEDSNMRDYLILRPDGNDSILSVVTNVMTGTNDFVFYQVTNSNAKLYCKEIATGESWRIEKDSDIAIYDMVTDGGLAYTCVPWGDAQTCWRLVYDEEGRPVALELIEEDIRKAAASVTFRGIR